MNTLHESKQVNYESMRDRLADNDACNYASGFDTEALYKMIKEGIKGYNNMSNEELVSIHIDAFGFIDYKETNDQTE
jgi:hypothetical protein